MLANGINVGERCSKSLSAGFGHRCRCSCGLPAWPVPDEMMPFVALIETLFSINIPHEVPEYLNLDLV